METNNMETPLLPMCKKIDSKSIGSGLESSKPKTLKELANGKPAKLYPFKYDTFHSILDMEEHLKKFFRSSF